MLSDFKLAGPAVADETDAHDHLSLLEPIGQLSLLAINSALVCCLSTLACKQCHAVADVVGNLSNFSWQKRQALADEADAHDHLLLF